GNAVCERAADVGLDLMRTIQRRQHSEIQKTASLLVQTGSAPDFTPAVLRHEFLQRAIEIISRCKRIIDKIRSQDLPPDRKALFKNFLIHNSLLSFNPPREEGWLRQRRRRGGRSQAILRRAEGFTPVTEGQTDWAHRRKYRSRRFSFADIPGLHRCHSHAQYPIAYIRRTATCS